MARLFSRYRGLRREIYILFVARLINSLGAFVYPLLTLIMTDKLGYTSDDAGFLITILLLSQAPAMLIGGKLADKFGRLKLIIVFQIFGAATYMVCGLIELSNIIVYLIVLASNFYALTYPAMDAITMDLTHSGQRKEAYALLYMGFNLGFAIGPMVGGILYKNFLPWIFIGDALTTIVSTVLVLIFIKETLPKKANAAAMPKLERYMEEPVWKVIWERKILVCFALILMIFQFAYSQWAFALPLQMKTLFENGAADYGLLASFNGVLVIVLTPLITIIVRKWKPLIGTVAGGILYAGAFGMLIYANNLPIFYLSMFIMTAGEVVITIDSQSFVADFSPSSHRARLNSIVNMISGTGRMLSPMIVGKIIIIGGIATGWLTVSSASMLGVLLLFAMTRHRGVRNQIKVLEEREEVDADAFAMVGEYEKE